MVTVKATGQRNIKFGVKYTIQSRPKSYLKAVHQGRGIKHNYKSNYNYMSSKGHRHTV